MLIKSFLRDRHQFIPVKRSPKTRRADLNGKRLIFLEKTLLLSLSIILILLHIFPRQKTKTEKRKDFNLSIEVIEVPVVKEELPPPTLPPVVHKVEKPFTPVIKQEKPDPRKIREELEDVTLDLNIDADSKLLTNSQMDEMSFASFDRSFQRNVTKVSLDLSTDRSGITGADANGLDLDLSTEASGPKIPDDDIVLDSPLTVSRETQTEMPQKDTNTSQELIELNENQFILKESESTIGTNEYRLWNRINAVFDRLDKNRFGNLPANVVRTASGLNVSFSYRDKSQHDIFWSKGGKVIIRVTGQRPRRLTTELEKAYDALFRLTL